MGGVFVLFALLAVFGISALALQISLSRKEDKRAGLILPAISFAISILALIGVIIFSAYTGITAFRSGPAAAIASQASPSKVFLLFNIPTAVFLFVYIYQRSRRGAGAAGE